VRAKPESFGAVTGGAPAGLAAAGVLAALSGLAAAGVLVAPARPESFGAVTGGAPAGLAAAGVLVALSGLAAAGALVAPARRGSLLLKPRASQVMQSKSDGASTRVPTAMMIPSIAAKLIVSGHE
jgi:hypothetical protein